MKHSPVTLKGCQSRRQRSATPRTGLTLIETLVCLALSGLLASGLYQAAHQIGQLQSAGDGLVERSNICLGLSELIHNDFQRIPYQFSESEPANQTLAMGSFMQAPEKIRERVLDLHQHETAEPLGFFGDPVGFAFPVMHPSESGEAVNIVAYRFSQAGRLDVPSHRVNGQVRQIPQTISQKSISLARVRVARSGEVEQTQVLWDAIGTFSVRYFDGERWHPDWDQHQGRRWPVAVELIVQEQHLTGALDGNAEVHRWIFRPPFTCGGDE